MSTEIYASLTDAEKREIRMYGVTVEQMRAAVESSPTFRFSGPGMMAMGILSDAQEMIAYDHEGTYSFMQVEDARQAMNRAKWVISTYLMEHKTFTAVKEGV
jgi:hypothetical protein